MDTVGTLVCILVYVTQDSWASGPSGQLPLSRAEALGDLLHANGERDHFLAVVAGLLRGCVSVSATSCPQLLSFGCFGPCGPEEEALLTPGLWVSMVI